jgi:hypothetical protein
MNDLNLDLLVDLFAVGKLKLNDAEWLYNKGYNVICKDGQVNSIEKRKDILIINKQIYYFGFDLGE